MPFYSTERRRTGGSAEQLTTDLLAGACNDDARFREAGWEETPASVEQLLLTDGFGTALLKIMGIGIKPAVGAIVASVYRCRVEQRGNPKRVPLTLRRGFVR